MGRSTLLAAGAASAAALYIVPAFVPALPHGSVQTGSSLRGATSTPTAEQSSISMTTVAGAAVLLAGISSAAGRRVAVARKAEPISAAAAVAAAAAAAKAGAAAAGAKAAAGAAGAGAAKAAGVAAGGKAAVGSTAVGAGTGKSLSGEEGSTGGSNPKFDPSKQAKPGQASCNFTCALCNI